MQPKLLLATATLVVLAIAEGLWPFFPGRTRRLQHYASNLLLALINALATTFLITGLLLFVTTRAQAAHIGLLPRLHFPVAVEFPLALLLFDAWQYLWHRLNHRVPLLWRFHAVHHSDPDMDASTAVRFHTGEILFSGLARLIIVPVLGITLPELAVYELLLLPVIMLHHSNVRLPPRLDTTLRALIVTPNMHRVHHSDLRPETDSNYASVLSLWDRLFQTYRHRPDPQNIQLGLKTVPSNDAHHFAKFFLAPFRRR